MADVGVTYVLTTPGPDITFNSGIEPFDGTDKYYIYEIRGLESPELRTPTDPVPLGDGALLHDFWFGAQIIEIEGAILVGSTQIENSIVVIRNDMEDDLGDALKSMMTATGTLAFTPQGESARSITVKYFTKYNTTHTDNYHTLAFSFGLISGDATT